MNQIFLSQVLQIGTGAAFILFPLIFIFAFSVHPGLSKPRLLQPEGIIRRARRNKLLQLAHSLVLLSTVVLIVMAIHFMKILNQGSAAWTGLIGAVLAVLGAILLAADKGALCLTMSALDTAGRKVFRNDAGPAGNVFQKGLDDPSVGNATLAGGVRYSGSRLPASQCAATLAKHPLFDRSVVGRHTGWNGNHQSQRLHSNGNRHGSLWDPSHRDRILG